MILKLTRIVDASFAMVSKGRFLSSNSTKHNTQARILQHKAYLASKIISKITEIDLDQIYLPLGNLNQEEKQKIIKEITAQPLSTKLLQMIEQQQQKHKLLPQAVDHMKSFFTTGVEFDSQVFNQQRIATATKQVCNDNQEPRFRLIPTYSVTGTIFKLINQNDLSACIFTGHYGISKSISFMLYSMLSKIIADETSKLKPLIINYPKLIYYTYRSTVDPFDFKLNMRKIILKQCKKEIPENQMDKFLVSGQGRKILKKYYMQKNIDLIFFVDQINKFLDQTRQLRILLQKLAHQNNNSSIKAKIDILQKSKANFIRAIGKICNEVGPIHFLSPLNIDKIRDDLSELADQDNHQRILHRTIQYMDIMVQEIGIYETVDCLLFLVEQKYKINFSSLGERLEQKQDSSERNHYQDQVLKLRKNLSDQLKKRIGTYVLTLHSMADAIHDLQRGYREALVQSFKSKQYPNFQKQMIRLLSGVIAISNKQIVFKVNQFFAKLKQVSQVNSQLIKARLFYSACAALQKDSLKPLTRFDVNLNIRQCPIKINMQQIQEFMGYDLFKKDGNKLQCLLPAKFIVQTLHLTINQTFSFLANNHLLKFAYDFDLSGFGKFMQMVFIKMVQQDRVEIRILLNKGKVTYTMYNIQNQQQTFNEISKYSLKRFTTSINSVKNQKMQEKQQILKRSQQIQLRIKYTNKYNFKYQFLQFISKHIKVLMQKKNQSHIYEHTYLFVPQAQQINLQPQLISQNNQTNSILQIVQANDSKNKCMEFILVDFDLRTKPIIRFHVFDFSMSQSQTKEKISNFVEDVCCFQDLKQTQISLGKYKIETKLNYHILTPIEYSGQLSKELNTDFGQYLNFTPLPGNNNACQVQRKKCKEMFLDKITVLKIGEELKVTQPSIQKKIQKEGFYRMWKEIQRRLASQTIPLPKHQ